MEEQHANASKEVAAVAAVEGETGTAPLAGVAEESADAVEMLRATGNAPIEKEPLSDKVPGSFAEGETGVASSNAYERKPGWREERVGELSDAAKRQALETAKRAEELGLPLRIEGPNGMVRELSHFEGDKPVYRETRNANAAISAGVDQIRDLAPFVDGSGVQVGVWDGGSVRVTHVEFGGRVTAVDGADPDDHATHVGGTIAAAGVNSSAKGMAPAAEILSYDWNDDRVEMQAAGASYPGEPGTIYLSNHSYGFSRGWAQDSSNGWRWRFEGDTLSVGDTNGEEEEFGRYSEHALAVDQIAWDLPYYLIFWASGNDRNDGPNAGDAVYLTSSGSTTVTYDPAIHPKGDGEWRENGYENIADEAIGKNVLTVGAVNDAVSVGTRSLAAATMSGFSTWGPADDGRVKPDLVANGVNLYSPLAGTDTSYANYSGTSMATPNAAGSAALLVDYYERLFPGHALRASTLKGLLIHTADDLGTPGPDYQNGHGLINVKAAADLLREYNEVPETQIIREGHLSGTKLSETLTFSADGSTRVRVTLSWTDPKGPERTAGDDHRPVLVNDLDVRVTDPNLTIHYPYVLPFALDENNSRTAAAVQQDNNVDTVEVIDIPTPVAGEYNITIDYDGVLSGSPAEQVYSLLITGNSGTPAMPAATVTQLTALSAGAARITGTGFLLGATVTLEKDGVIVPAFGTQINPDRIDFLYDASTVTNLADWTAVVAQPVSPLTQPIMTLSTTALSHTSDVGLTVPDKTFTIENTGAGSFTYAIASDSAWLSAVPDTGNNSGIPETITVSVDTSALESGQHVGTLTISSPEAANAPRSVTYTLQLIPTIPDAVDNVALPYTNDASNPWVPVILTGATGNDALASGIIGNNSSTTFSMDLSGPGLLTFAWKVDSETDFDFLRLYLNGVMQSQISGLNQPWIPYGLSIPSGTNTVEWRYEKDAYLGEGEDRGWIDNIQFDYGKNPSVILFSEGFNFGGYTNAWLTEIVNNPSGNAPALDIVSSSTHPTGFTPVEGDGFLRFNSYTCEVNDSIRLTTAAPISTSEYEYLRLYFSWTVDAEFSAQDYLQLQWSTDGATWQNLGDPYYRYRSNGSNEWLDYGISLPPAAETSDIYLALLFNGDFGNDCHLDNLVIRGVAQNAIPTAITIDTNTVDENAISGILVGTLATTDPDADDIHAYSLVAGNGDTDNARFTIDGDTLLTAEVFDYETQNSFAVRVRSTDAAGAFLERELTITVNDLNEAPSTVTIDTSAVDENAISGILVGTLATADPDADDTHAYSLVAGNGDTDNARFTIDGDTLVTAEVFDYETQNSFAVRVRSTDAAGAFLETEFTITVNDLNEAPTAISLDQNRFAASASVGDTIGILSTSDPDAGDSFTYSLVGGEGAENNALFEVSGSLLRTAVASPSVGTYSIRVASTDSGGLKTEDIFTLAALDSATITLSGLQQTYDGNPKAVTVVTDPENLPIEVTYNGSPTPPSDAGSYAIEATVTDPQYVGSANGTLVIEAATATVTLSGLEQAYDGNPKAVGVITDPVGLVVEVTYDGSLTPPDASGTYAVQALVVNPNYTGSANGVLTIAYPQTLNLAPPVAIAENRILEIPVNWTSQGNVTALTLEFSYSPAFLRAPAFVWDDALTGGSVQIDEEAGTVRLLYTAAVPQTLPSGPISLGTLSFITRSGPEAASLQLGASVISLSDAFGDPISAYTHIESPDFTLTLRSVPGDANNNGVIDISDTVELIRLILNPLPSRTWDVTLNDLSGDGFLTGGDLVKALRVVAALDAEPTFPASSPASVPGYAPMSLAPGPGPFPMPTAVPTNSQATVTWTRTSATTVVAAISLPFDEPDQSGITFALAYPVDILRIAGFSSLAVTNAFPAGTTSVWNVLPGNDFANPVGEVHLAASWNGPATLSAGTALATITFEVLPSSADIVHYPMHLSDFALAPSAENAPAFPIPLADTTAVYSRTFADWVESVFGDPTVLPDQDSDGDGQSNYMEYLASTDATDAQSRFMPLYAPASEGGLTLRIPSVFGVQYELQSSNDLQSWSPMGVEPSGSNPLVGDGSLIEFTLPPPTTGEKDFYRVEILP